MINFFESQNSINNETPIKQSKFYKYAMKGIKFISIYAPGCLLVTLFNLGAFGEGFTYGLIKNSMINDLFYRLSNSTRAFSSGLNALGATGMIPNVVEIIFNIFAFPAALLGSVTSWATSILFKGGFVNSRFSISDKIASGTLLCILCAIALAILYKICKYFYTKWKKRKIKES